MSDDRLRIRLTPEESDALGTVAIAFEVWQGSVFITEEWKSMDELWSSAVTIKVPPRVWNEALPWIQQSMLIRLTPTGTSHGD